MEIEINCVSDYIKKIAEINRELKQDSDSFLVYRGEPVIYPTAGMPGIFREDYLERDSFFERNILLEMKANKLTEGENYLQMAIDAQHGGFPSRLLDVTYNSLIALYFACVSKPEKEKSEKDEPGQVLVFRINKAYCPTAANVIDNYRKILENPNAATNEKIFEGNHKFIDHIKINSRIIAQQGALILFQGKEWKPIPERCINHITIPAENKSAIAKDLEIFFGITTSFVYPEIDYAIEKIKGRARRIISDEFSIKNELKMCFEVKKDDLEYEIIRISNLADEEEMVKEIIVLEKSLELWKKDIEQFCQRYAKQSDEKQDGYVDENTDIFPYFNEVIQKYESLFEYYIMPHGIESCGKELLIGGENGKKS